MAVWSTGWLHDHPIGWLLGQLAGWLVVNRSAKEGGWLAACLAHRPAGHLYGWKPVKENAKALAKALAWQGRGTVRRARESMSHIVLLKFVVCTSNGPICLSPLRPKAQCSVPLNHGLLLNTAGCNEHVECSAVPEASSDQHRRKQRHERQRQRFSLSLAGADLRLALQCNTQSRSNPT